MRYNPMSMEMSPELKKLLSGELDAVPPLSEDQQADAQDVMELYGLDKAYTDRPYNFTARNGKVIEATVLFGLGLCAELITSQFETRAQLDEYIKGGLVETQTNQA